MAANLFTTLAKGLFGAGASQQSIPRTEPETPLEQVNAAVTKTNQYNLNLQQQQLHATVEPESVKPAAVVVSDNQEISNQELLAMAQNGIEVKISKDTFQKVLTVVKPFLSDLKGNLDKFLSTPFDKPMTGGEFFGQYLKKLEPLMKIVIPPIMNYLDKFPTGQTSLNPANTEAAPNPA